MPKGTPIHVHLLDDPDVKQFAEVAEKVCDLFERMDDLSEVEFLVGLKDILALAYSLAHRLPDPYDWQDDEDDDDVDGDDQSVEWERPPQGMSEAEHMALWKNMYQRIGQKLGAHSHIAFVFDPTSPDEREVVDGELAHFLAVLYADLKGGLILCGRSSDEERAQGLWDWRFGMTHGWGSKLAQAFLPIHSLLQHHYDDIGEEWWANYNDEEASS